jgi:hypothetical protein
VERVRDRSVRLSWAPGHRSFAGSAVGGLALHAAPFGAVTFNPGPFRAAAHHPFRGSPLGGPAHRAFRAPALETAALVAFGGPAFGAFHAAARRPLGVPEPGLLGAGWSGALGTGTGTGRDVGRGGAVQRAAGQLGRWVAGGWRAGRGRPGHPVDRQRPRLGWAPAVMTLKEIREALGLRGVDTDHHAWLAHRLPERVTHVTGQRIRRSRQPMHRTPSLPCLFQPRSGVTGTRDQLRITHRAIPPLNATRCRAPRPGTAEHTLRPLASRGPVCRTPQLSRRDYRL